MRSYSRKLRREDWDFDGFSEVFQQGEGNGEGELRLLYRAFVYEYARSTPALIRAFRRDRASLRFHDGTWRCLLVVPKDGQIHPDECFPYFDSGSYDPLYLPHSDLPIYEFDELIAPSGFPRTPFLKSDFGTFAYSPWVRSLPRPQPISRILPIDGGWVDESKQPAKADEIAHFRVRWEASDESIRQAFGEWLKKNRPRDSLEKRGMNAGRKLWVDLKALGVWRLMRIFRDQVPDARKYCETHKGKSIFQRDEDWRIARDRAQQIINDFSGRILTG